MKKIAITVFMITIIMTTQPNTPFLKIGHRGACGYTAENSLESFQKGIALGADMIEFDVHQCASGEIVVIHDETVDRTTTGTGTVMQLTHTELQTFALHNNARIPTLHEALHCIARKAIVNIELKGANTALPVAEIINEFIALHGWQLHDFIVSSFDHVQLRAIKELLPSLRIGILFDALPDDYATYIEQFNAYSINLKTSLVTTELIADAHARGLLVCVYTVNDPGQIAQYKALGVDGIFSDFPDRL